MLIGTNIWKSKNSIVMTTKICFKSQSYILRCKNNCNGINLYAFKVIKVLPCHFFVKSIFSLEIVCSGEKKNMLPIFYPSSAWQRVLHRNSGYPVLRGCLYFVVNSQEVMPIR